MSAYFICCFTGNALPVIGAGFITTHVGALAASTSFAVFIVVFALAAIACAFKYAADRSTSA
jgi:hypothetical protein